MLRFPFLYSRLYVRFANLSIIVRPSTHTLLLYFPGIRKGFWLAFVVVFITAMKKCG